MEHTPDKAVSSGYTKYELRSRETAFFDDGEIIHDGEVAAVGKATLWKTSSSGSRSAAWGGVIDADLDGLGTIGAALILRLPNGNNARFLIHRITAETRVQISGEGEPPF